MYNYFFNQAVRGRPKEKSPLKFLHNLLFSGLIYLKELKGGRF